jgi:hypothetical protein
VPGVRRERLCGCAAAHPAEGCAARPLAGSPERPPSPGSWPSRERAKSAPTRLRAAAQLGSRLACRGAVSPQWAPPLGCRGRLSHVCEEARHLATAYDTRVSDALPSPLCRAASSLSRCTSSGGRPASDVVSEGAGGLAAAAPPAGLRCRTQSGGVTPPLRDANRPPPSLPSASHTQPHSLPCSFSPCFSPVPRGAPGGRAALGGGEEVVLAARLGRCSRSGWRRSRSGGVLHSALTSSAPCLPIGLASSARAGRGGSRFCTRRAARRTLGRLLCARRFATPSSVLQLILARCCHPVLPIP